MAAKLGEPEGGGLGHSNEERPWVFSMIDCFLLIVNFFIITFKFKCEEPILPQRMPAGMFNKAMSTPVSSRKQVLYVSVKSSPGGAVYEYMTKNCSLEELQGTLAAAKAAAGGDVSVRVSYDGEVRWKDVMAVFNACQKAQIMECGLSPLRAG